MFYAGVSSALCSGTAQQHERSVLSIKVALIGNYERQVICVDVSPPFKGIRNGKCPLPTRTSAGGRVEDGEGRGRRRSAQRAGFGAGEGGVKRATGQRLRVRKASRHSAAARFRRRCATLVQKVSVYGVQLPLLSAWFASPSSRALVSICGSRCGSGSMNFVGIV